MSFRNCQNISHEGQNLGSKLGVKIWGHNWGQQSNNVDNLTKTVNPSKATLWNDGNFTAWNCDILMCNYLVLILSVVFKQNCFSKYALGTIATAWNNGLKRVRVEKEEQSY